ncbi:hypothetical protein L484_016285 [Morus notabilis]|uniref:Uncharacterized protein n=1 Tax=Morus notabilis TaxID=981085 RepID=W9RGX1_9ROSA|nr:hypothetical protein L484_016285 [Morus notabilis]
MVKNIGQAWRFVCCAKSVCVTVIAPNGPSDELTSSKNRRLQVIPPGGKCRRLQVTAPGGEARRPQVIATGREAQHSQEIAPEGEDSSRGRKGCATVPVNDARKSKR